MDRARRRKFGQNFLDVPTAQMIAGDLPANEGEAVLEQKEQEASAQIASAQQQLAEKRQQLESADAELKKKEDLFIKEVGINKKNKFGHYLIIYLLFK